MIKDVFIVPSGRLLSTAGKAFWTNGEIRLSVPIFSQEENEAGFSGIVLHELSHIIANRIYNRNVGHSNLWRVVCKKVGGDAKRNHTLIVKAQKTRANHVIKLVCCGESAEVGPGRFNSWKGGKHYYHPNCKSKPNWRADAGSM